jgi:hypothetical protein
MAGEVEEGNREPYASELATSVELKHVYECFDALCAVSSSELSAWHSHMEMNVLARVSAHAAATYAW